MANLIYAAITSLDGYIEDADGNFDWAMPDDEMHAFANDLERATGTSLYGRRMYETMSVWQTLDVADEPEVIRDYAKIWQATDKVVYSRTLEAVSTPKTRIEHTFDPTAVRDMKASATRDISIGGANIAASALRAGLVDEIHLFLTPVIVGGGKRALPDGVKVKLELREERRFGNGTVYLRYGVNA